MGFKKYGNKYVNGAWVRELKGLGDVYCMYTQKRRRWNGYKSRNAKCVCASFFDRREALYSVVIHRYIVKFVYIFPGTDGLNTTRPPISAYRSSL